MKIENRDKLNVLLGLSHSIDVFTDQPEVADLAREIRAIIQTVLDSERGAESK